MHSIVIDSKDSRTLGYEKVMFTFGSGRLDYDCVTCGATCCRGAGFALHAGESVPRAVSTNAPFALFVERGGASAQVRNCPPGCFFLDEDRRCRIHVEDGYAAKPETCRLFPFNYLRRIGGCLIVSPHTTLCPLQIVLPPRRSQRSEHALLMRELHMAGVAAPVPEITSSHDDIGGLLALCVAIVEAAEACIGEADYLSFIEAVETQTRREFGPSHGVRALGSLEGTICRVLGFRLPSTGPDRAVTRAWMGAAATVWSDLVFKTAATPSKSSMRAETASAVLVALHVFGQAAKRAGMTSVTFQTLLRILKDNWCLLRLLGYLDTVVMFRSTEPIRWPLGAGRQYEQAYLTVVKSLLCSQDEKTLAEHLEPFLPEDLSERYDFLRIIASPLTGALVPSAQASRKVRRAWWSLQHAALRRVAAAPLLGLANGIQQGRRRRRSGLRS